MDQPLLSQPPSPVALHPLDALCMCRLDSGLQCFVVPSWNIYGT